MKIFKRSAWFSIIVKNVTEGGLSGAEVLLKGVRKYASIVFDFRKTGCGVLRSDILKSVLEKNFSEKY